MTFTPCNLSFRQLEVLVDHSEKDRPINIKSSKYPSVLALLKRELLRKKNLRTTTITRYGHDKMIDALRIWGDLAAVVDGATFAKLHVGDGKTPKEAEVLADRHSPSLADLVREAVLPQPPEAFAGANQALGEEHRELRVHDPAAG